MATIDPEQLSFFERRLAVALRRFERARLNRDRARVRITHADAAYHRAIELLAKLERDVARENHRAAA